MVADFTVNIAEIDRAIANLTEKANELQTQAKMLDDEVSTLSVQWKGNASAQFNADLTKYQESMNRMAKLVRHLADKIRGAMTLYTTTDDGLVYKMQNMGTVTARAIT